MQIEVAPAQYLTEYDLQVAVTDYLRWQYPLAIFRSDLAGVRLTPGVAQKMKRIQGERGFPDLAIWEARLHYHGMVLELKTSRDEVFTVKGELLQDKHIQEQAQMLEELTQRGYFAVWGLGFDETKALIDMYLSS